MNVSKPLIVVVILIVVLYVIGVGCGLAPKDNTFNRNDTTLTSLQNLLANPQTLTFDDLDAPGGCVNSFTRRLTVTKGNTCTYTVRASGSPVRRITLNLLSNSSVTATLEQRNGLRVTQTLPVTNPLDVYKDGGTLIITCGAFSVSDCVLAL